VLPKSTEEVVETVRLLPRAHTFRPSRAGRGSPAAAGLEGGGDRPQRMNRVLEVDYVNQRAVIEPGLINIWLTYQVSPEGYYYAPDPAARLPAALAETSPRIGGPHCLKYGVTTNHVLGLELVLPSGEIIEVAAGARSARLRSHRRVRGLRGTFGIVTKIVASPEAAEAVKTMLLSSRPSPTPAPPCPASSAAHHPGRHRDDGLFEH